MSKEFDITKLDSFTVKVKANGFTLEAYEPYDPRGFDQSAGAELVFESVDSLLQTINTMLPKVVLKAQRPVEKEDIGEVAEAA